MSSPFRREAEALAGQLVADRRDFHQHPELGYEERRTAQIVAERLRALGYQVTERVGMTGVVGLLPPQTSQSVVMLRFDMDALPIDDAKDVVYRSQAAGRMHACGHDAHVAIGLGVAALLARHRDELRGGVKLVFQPAEENGGGATRMVDEGVLEHPHPMVAFGLHVWSGLPVGMVNVRPGPFLATANGFQIRVLGPGGHAAQPHTTVDVILVAAQIIVALQTITSRSVDPEQPAVISVGTLQAGVTRNIIPNEAQLGGTIRTYEEATLLLIHRRIEEVATGIGAAYGAQVEVRYGVICPATVNAREPTALLRRAAEAVVGGDHVIDTERAMVSEDMAVFLNHVPGCFFFVGARNEARGITHPHHSPNFDIDEQCLPVGVAVLCEAVMHYWR